MAQTGRHQESVAYRKHLFLTLPEPEMSKPCLSICPANLFGVHVEFLPAHCHLPVPLQGLTAKAGWGVAKGQCLSIQGPVQAPCSHESHSPHLPSLASRPSTSLIASLSSSRRRWISTSSSCFRLRMFSSSMRSSGVKSGGSMGQGQELVQGARTPASRERIRAGGLDSCPEEEWLPEKGDGRP